MNRKDRVIDQIRTAESAEQCEQAACGYALREHGIHVDAAWGHPDSKAQSRAEAIRVWALNAAVDGKHDLAQVLATAWDELDNYWKELAERTACSD